MIYNRHSEIEGTHAVFGASQHAWLRYDEDKAMERFVRKDIPRMGTVLHDYACGRINNRIKMSKHDKNAVLNELMLNYIPNEIIDIPRIMDTLVPYVNDAIGFRMSAEVPLKYSKYFYGTADAIDYNERTNILRIHDLKTGEIPASMEQLEIYAAFFFLEYKNIKLADTKMELRIYQNGNVLEHFPTSEDILPIMDQAKRINKLLMAREENM